MKIKPKVLVLKADGTNCDEELAFAFNVSGGNAEIVHVNQLRNKEKKFRDFNILALPGGFAYGDDIVSGKILAVELISFFSDELKKFVERKDTLVIGICNGFQVLILTGLLPFGNIGTINATLTNNESGLFQCRWVKIKQEKSACVFLKNAELITDVSVNHGEGKFLATPDMIQKIEDENLVVFRYVDANSKPTQNYPENPNGSINAIAGICDPTGRILGLMPHPEKFNHITNHPNWRRMSASEQITKPAGLTIFENMINYVQKA
ncbi:MAG: phosphoribosylformylglycinamidine synthase I [Candidatus Levyibacteriota bacterium]|nr:MAG: phosphoribosylformylglycinamidine synthase I [Candidatus Levybacteria bacterium]